MEQKPKRTRSDSIAGQIGRATAQQKQISAPEGCDLDKPEEKILWRQFTSARAADHWRDFDLLMLWKMVKLEVQIRKHNLMLEKTGPLLENKRGTLVENPLLRVVDTLQRQQLAIIRSLSLGVSSDTGRSANRSGEKHDDDFDLQQIKNGKVLSLMNV